MIPTRRSTAGIGFDFEDYVAGWLLLQSLAGREIPVQGQAQRLQMQTSSLGWDIDDILLTTQDEVGDHRLAVSCKANVQVSANGFPLSFAKQAWRLWTNGDGPFNRAADAMALATQGTHTGFQAAWGEIKRSTSGADPALAIAEIASNSRYKRVVESLKSASGAGDADVIALIRRVEVLPFDFHQAQSRDEREAIAVARSLLADGTLEDAKSLWSDIIGRARETRLGSGTLDFAELLRWLRPRFSLKVHPDLSRPGTACAR